MIDNVLVKAMDRKYVKNVKAITGMLQHIILVMDVISKEREEEGGSEPEERWQETQCELSNKKRF